jgi:hypothetical protein
MTGSTSKRSLLTCAGFYGTEIKLQYNTISHKILMIIYFSLYLCYLNNFNQNYHFSYYGVIVLQLTTLVFLYSCIIVSP